MKRVFRQIYILTIVTTIAGCDISQNKNIGSENTATEVDAKVNVQKVSLDTAFTFEKIIFHTTGCEGNCPTYHLSVNKDKTIELHSEIVYKASGFNLDKAKIGYFKGSVSDTSFAKLLCELKNIGLDTLNFGDTKGYDAPIKTIIVYYNDKRKFFKAMFHSKNSNRLVETLYEICTSSDTKKVNKKFVIEKASI
jgi:hypothetical protein